VRPSLDASITKPNFDAPVSAVNAGERRVTVKCREAFITLPVTLSTTAKDILNSASLCMSESIDAKTAILLEAFSQLGLERPLRRYERIRDVMNSWDNDSQNHLFIMAASDCAAPGLQTADAPSQQPFATTVQIYHSQRPGKWDKRWLKLREDGQITTSKNENGIDSTNICHVSDFDLYTPTTKQLKKLKPPRKLCYALKSQEKSAVFLDGANFVHFFCTKDKVVADRWYHAVHAWRSWYLVNMLGEGQRQPTETNLEPQLSHRPGTSGSKESMPYVLGSFKPLLDFGSLRRPSQSHGQRPLIDFVPARPSFDEIPTHSKFPTKPSAAPPTAFPKKFMVEPAINGNGIDEEGPFTGTGLLARSASRRTQGGSRAGHGVAGADGKPLVDLAPTSEFTDGSLLRRMETIAARQGAFEPRIDREKRREVDIAVGEGF
jgi:transposase